MNGPLPNEIRDLRVASPKWPKGNEPALIEDLFPHTGCVPLSLGDVESLRQIMVRYRFGVPDLSTDDDTRRA